MAIFDIRCEGDIEEAIRRTKKGEIIMPRIFSERMGVIFNEAIEAEIQIEAEKQLKDTFNISDLLKEFGLMDEEDEIEDEDEDENN
jgi:hypothetical protein